MMKRLSFKPYMNSGESVFVVGGFSEPTLREKSVEELEAQYNFDAFHRKATRWFVGVL